MPEIQSGQKQAAQTQPLGVLPPGTMLHHFKIVSVLGHGGFGVTYLAQDTRLHRDVAIKEYLPTALALRHDGSTVLPRSTDLGADFIWGRERFLDEARILAKLEGAPAVVRVIDFLEANGTAYMVMTLVKGETLEQRLRREGTLDAETVQRLLPPLVDGLRQVHKAGFLHRDIKPANVLLDEARNPTLIDFGASRAAMASRTTAMTAIFTPGYAAAEQFTSGKQGPWTDIYGLCATLHHAIVGQTPPSAFERVLDDAYEPLSQLSPTGFPQGLLRAIDAGLAVRAGDRPQTIDDWYALVEGKPALDRTDDANATVLLARPKPAPASAGRSRRTALWSAVAAIVLLIGGGGAYIATRPSGHDPAIAAAAAAAQKARDDAAANEAARRKAEEDLARLRAEAAAREKEAADAAQRRQIEEETRRKIAAEQAAEAAAKAKADEEARQKAEADAAAKRAAEEADKKTAEANETALRLSTLDRQHLQVALTAAGFNTGGTDGAFGPHTREMIAAWQKAHNQAATGFLTGAQQQSLQLDGAAAIRKYDDDKKGVDDRPKAEDDAKAKSAAAPAAPAAAPMASRVESDSTGRNLTVTVRSGVEVRVNMHAHRDGCVQLSVPTVELTNAPTNGQASIRVLATHVGGCSDLIEQTAISYRSKPGYVGPDSFSYDRKPNAIVPGKSRRPDTVSGIYRVTVDVKP